LRGKGTDQDSRRAAQWLQHGCDLGDGVSYHALSHMYSSGDGVPKDEIEAKKLWDRGCEIVGNAPPCVVF